MRGGLRLAEDAPQDEPAPAWAWPELPGRDEAESPVQQANIDLYQMHAGAPTTPIKETMATLDGFVRTGKVRYIGCCT